MKFKNCHYIGVKTETGNTFGYIPRFCDDKLVCLHTVGSRGDIFPADPESYEWMQPNDEVSVDTMQVDFNTRVVDVWCEEISEAVQNEFESEYRSRKPKNYSIIESRGRDGNNEHVIVKDDTGAYYNATIVYPALDAIK